MQLSQRGLMIAEKRIFAKDAQGNVVEDFDGMCRRVASFLGDSQEEVDDFYWVMNNHYFLPNSPCLVNAGMPNRKNQLSACFVLSVPDSIEGIYDVLKETALIHKSGGGTGFSFSHIRPANDKVSSTNGIASGPVSFMKVFDASTEGIKQGGVRRGANMGVLRVDHPDILEFINVKRSKVSLQNFNISVALTDAFMEAMMKGGEYELINPHTKQRSMMNAKTVWDAIVDNAWTTGDPGILFIDRINEHNPLTGARNIIEATNPCVTGDTKIYTSKGYIKIADVINTEVEVWNGIEFSKVTPKITGYNKDLLKITLSNGKTLECTKNHKFITRTGKVEAKDLSIGDQLKKFEFPVLEGIKELTTSYAYTLGFFCGDGSQETARDRNSIWLYGIKKDLLSYLEFESYNKCDNDRIFVKMRPSVYDKTFVPTAKYTIKSRLDYLAGIIDSDGTINDSGGSIGIWSSNKDYLKELIYMLNTLGVDASLNIGTPSGTKAMPNGLGSYSNYQTQDCYRLVISAWNVKKLRELGLQTHRVSVDANPNRNASRFIRVTNIEPSGVADKVYCFTEDKLHQGVFNGILTGQCGEQPLVPNEVCGLGSINLSLMVKDYGINYTLLEKVTDIAVRFLNRMMSKSEYPNEKIAKRVDASRKIGLGFMGWADMLIKMKIAYSSQDALEIAENVIQKMLDSAVKTNHELGKKQGVFPLIKDYKMPTHIKDSLKRNKIKISDYKPAHSTLLTIAPTGTISMLADCSSGCEPIFCFEQAENRAESEYIYIHPIYQAFKEKFPKAEIPPYFEEASEIDPDQHIYMQATFQKYICSGVSKTVNLPASATKPEVEKIYKEAFILGCKGVTVYRDGSLDNQVLSNANTIKDNYITPIARPEVLKGLSHQIKTGYGDMLVTINYKDGEPFEVTCMLGKSGAAEMAKAEGISRLASMLLRCRVHPKVIIEQLEGIVGGNPTMTKHGLVKSIPDALAKILIHHVIGKENHSESVPAMMRCADCGKSEFLYKEGSCTVCGDCGWKSCGG